MDIKKFVRPNILSLKAYSSARDEYKGHEGIFLDANENPYGEYNRYPDAYQAKLKEKLAALKKVSVENIFVGNGSDEAIDLTMRIFCNPEKDKILTFEPSYGMYEVSADTNDVQVLKLPLNENFEIDYAVLTKMIPQHKPKIIFFCSPNNPTGNVLPNIEKILDTFQGIIVIDEAYIDFCPEKTNVPLLEKYPNLIIIQTLSKAWGLAGLRIGMAIASKEIIALYNKIKPPYNISTINQDMACSALDNIENYKNQVELIKNERARVIKEIVTVPNVTKVYPSDANFILVETTDAPRLYKVLVDHKIIVRNRHSVINNCLRITIGSTQENDALLSALRTSK
jgi:histidinol-phosphate aminotransferase